MHLLHLSEPVNLGRTLGTLQAGSWLMHDLNAFEIAIKAKRGTAKVESYFHVDPRPLRYDNEGNRITLSTLVMRSGAIGDLLLLTPALTVFDEKSPSVLSCFKHHHELFSLFFGPRCISGLQKYPLPFEDIKNYSQIISLENTMECDHTQHATDVFAQALGLKTPLADYRPIYHVTDAEKAATEKHIFKGRPTIAIQPKASVANRDYPLPKWMEVIRKLESQGWGVVILGRKGQIPPMPPQWQNPFIRDLSQLDLSFRQSAAVLSQCAAFCGVDSAWAHMCHALDIPAVVLFAAFDWKTRTSKAPKTIAVTGVGECAPCNWHMHAGHQFPPNKPCSKVGLCTVLADITPERIISKINLVKP